MTRTRSSMKHRIARRTRIRLIPGSIKVCVSPILRYWSMIKNIGISCTNSLTNNRLTSLTLFKKYFLICSNWLNSPPKLKRLSVNRNNQTIRTSSFHWKMWKTKRSSLTSYTISIINFTFCTKYLLKCNSSWISRSRR